MKSLGNLTATVGAGRRGQIEDNVLVTTTVLPGSVVPRPLVVITDGGRVTVEGGMVITIGVPEIVEMAVVPGTVTVVGCTLVTVTGKLLTSVTVTNTSVSEVTV